ncbi:Proline iminopeptidase [Smittium mucronatum]|uniref:Proline iminopeptidase n=1 Tax=Smittium mucronatum TaxID=133383 RepID=A0A1R0H717_9FUNG|nr:Proline iminopeptidase [Smittium mucronatum]
MPDTTIHELDRSDIESYVIPGGKVYNRFFQCPLDYEHPEGERIQVYVRHLVPPGKIDMHKSPFLLYLQAIYIFSLHPKNYFFEFGGPGFQSPNHSNLSGGWVGIMLAQGYQILLLDQRGTGLSTAINSSSKVLGLPSIEEQVKYMTNFRADSIVRDCEYIRKILVAGRDTKQESANSPSSKFTLLGQSFGGFCITTYLSFLNHPEGIEKAIITGGVPPLTSNPVDIYSKLIPRVALRNKLYYQMYNADIARVRRIVKYLDENTVYLPGNSIDAGDANPNKKSGNILTPKRFQQLGISFGSSVGFSAVHKIILNMENDLNLNNKLSFKTLNEFEQFFSFDTNVIYAILHESIYCNGSASGASNWACDRAISGSVQNSALFDYESALSCSDQPIYFFGEMIFPWMTRDIYGTELSRFGELAEALAKYDKWKPLYNIEALNNNIVPVVAVSYYDDPYVDLDFSIECADNIKGCQLWITNEYLHK